jgi:hypothetical protein
VKKLSLLFVLCGLILLSGCVAIHSVSISHMDTKGSNPQMTQASAMGFLTLTVPDMNELETKALSDLRNQGYVKNVRFRLEMRNFWIIQLYRVIAIGER